MEKRRKYKNKDKTRYRQLHNTIKKKKANRKW